jgi:phenylalanyl-tRNA synthetase beta chain
VIGSFGELASSVVRAFDLAGPVYVLDADVEGLIRRAGEVRLYEKITRYPAAVRDVAFVVEESIPVGDLLDGIREAAGNHLERIQVFDVYRGEQLPTGSKSVAFSLSFRAADRTLTDEEIDAASAAVVDLLRERWGAAVRGATPA